MLLLMKHINKIKTTIYILVLILGFGVFGHSSTIVFIQIVLLALSLIKFFYYKVYKNNSFNYLIYCLFFCDTYENMTC
jgi:hypothetical protein